MTVFRNWKTWDRKDVKLSHNLIHRLNIIIQNSNMGFIRTDKSKVLWRSTNITKTTFKKRVAASVHFYPVLLVYIYSNQENVTQSSTKKNRKPRNTPVLIPKRFLAKVQKQIGGKRTVFCFVLFFYNKEHWNNRTTIGKKEWNSSYVSHLLQKLNSKWIMNLNL